MEQSKIMQILEETAYIRTSGSPEELKCAHYLMERCAEIGLCAHLEPFAVQMGTVRSASLEIDGVSIPCTGYKCAGSGTVEAPLFYLTNTDPWSLSQVMGKIVLLDGGGLRYWTYQYLCDNGALGYITYTGSCFHADRDIDQKELRPAVSKGRKLIGVNINAKSAVELMKGRPETAKIVLEAEEQQGFSHNVVADLPGEVPETIVISAHYDSTPLSVGTYDNMSGCVGVLGLAQYFTEHPHHYSLRFLFCGSEERGLLGSKAYCEAHQEDLGSILMDINMDMIGSIMGPFVCCCTCEEKLVHYLQYLGMEEGFGIKAYQDVYPSDSTPFADQGVPAVTFARDAPGSTAVIHNRYDTVEVLKAQQMEEDIRLIALFAQRMACAKHFPVAREIPENLKEKLDIYNFRKRDNK